MWNNWPNFSPSEWSKIAWYVKSEMFFRQGSNEGSLVLLMTQEEVQYVSNLEKVLLLLKYSKIFDFLFKYKMP